MNELHVIGKNTTWLKLQMQEHHIKLKDIFLAEFWEDRVVFVMTDGRMIK